MGSTSNDHTTFSYDAAGQRTLKELGNGTRASFTYDRAGQLTNLWNLKSDDAVISSFDYAYDHAGNRTAVLEADGSRVTWSYDDSYQLTNEHRSGPHAYNTTYGYDPVGNRSVLEEDGATTTYAYDNANQLLTSEAAAGVTTYGFDADGNQELTEEPGGARTTYSWDLENQMSRAALPSAALVTMAYNAVQRRMRKEAGTVTQFLWDVANDSYLAELNANDLTEAVYTNEPAYFGKLVSQRRDGATSTFHFDGQPSTREISNLNEVVTATATYTAFGKVVEVSDSVVNPFWYMGDVGFYEDSATSNYLVRQSIYRPEIARWLSTTRLRWTPAYDYTRDNPVSTRSQPEKQQAGLRVYARRLPTDRADADWQCGQVPTLVFSFFLDQPSPCDGYFVQKIMVRCNWDPTCEQCPKDMPAKPDFQFFDVVYYEAFAHPEGIPAGQSLVRDFSSTIARDDTCGWEMSIGEVRFYCESETGDLDTDINWPRFLPHSGGQCSKTAGDLPSTGNRPAFWDDAKPLAMTSRIGSVFWNCCDCSDSKHVWIGSVPPEFSQR